MVSTESPVFRPLANFEPSLWGNLFTSFSVDYKTKETYTEEHEGLLEKVRMMFLDASKLKIPDKINFINTLERLGVSYHMEREIEDQLHQMFDAHSKFQDDIQQFDLFTLGIYFRILRQHGYNISCDVFKKLKDSNGKFKEELKDDVIGILSLYEATHVRTHGDDILDEAFVYTKAQLEFMSTASLSSFLGKQVTHALIQSLHKGIPRIESRNYISVYEEDPNKNDLLLRFSKIDFNLLQMLHKQELCDVSRWWNDMEFETKLSYARNRVAEAYLWTLSAYYEPKYSLARRILVKLMVLVSLTDDTYDAYGTLDELQLFTDAIERLDKSSINQLPDYMKIIYKALLDYFEETEDILWKNGIINASHRVNYAKYMYKEIVNCYDTEYKWFSKRYVPDFEEYMQKAVVTSGNNLLITFSFQGMDQVASIKAFEWVKSHPKMVVSSNKVSRLVDDIMSHEEEDARGHVATGIECYQKKYGGSREEIVAEFYKRIDDAWKDVNEEFIKPDKLPLEILMRVLNLTRIIDVMYKYDDGYTHPQKGLKDHIISLFVNPIII